jgi:broad specificity phosphatase PhoE
MLSRPHSRMRPHLVDHAETAWSLTGLLTNSTELPLTERGERNALRLRERLRGLSFVKVFCSPIQCVAQTCELAGFGAVAEFDSDLVEWNYGSYEGRRASEILNEQPAWDLFRDGCPGGELPEQVGMRANRVVGRARSFGGNLLIFSSRHFIRVLAARWIGLEGPAPGRQFVLNVASLSALGYECSQAHPVICFWNDVHYLAG